MINACFFILKGGAGFHHSQKLAAFFNRYAGTFINRKISHMNFINHCIFTLDKLWMGHPSPLGFGFRQIHYNIVVCIRLNHHSIWISNRCAVDQEMIRFEFVVTRHLNRIHISIARIPVTRIGSGHCIEFAVKPKPYVAALRRPYGESRFSRSISRRQCFTNQHLTAWLFRSNQAIGHCLFVKLHNDFTDISCVDICAIVLQDAISFIVTEIVRPVTMYIKLETLLQKVCKYDFNLPDIVIHKRHFRCSPIVGRSPVIEARKMTRMIFNTLDFN